MFGVDEGANAALLLRLGDDMQRQGRFARGFRPVNLDHPPARQAADAERDIESQRPRRDRLDLHRFLVLAEPHDRAFAEGAFDLRQSGVQRLGLVHGSSFHEAEIGLRHGCSSFCTVGGETATAAACESFVHVLFSRASSFFVPVARLPSRYENLYESAVYVGVEGSHRERCAPLCLHDEDMLGALALAMRVRADSHCPFLPAQALFAGANGSRFCMRLAVWRWRLRRVVACLGCSRKRNRLVLAFDVFEKFSGRKSCETRLL